MAHTVLVTGAAGFLGSHLCDALLAEGATVIGVDNLCTGDTANLAHLRDEARFTFVEQDICQPFDVGAVDYSFINGRRVVDEGRLTSAELPRLIETVNRLAAVMVQA